MSLPIHNTYTLRLRLGYGGWAVVARPCWLGYGGWTVVAGLWWLGFGGWAIANKVTRKCAQCSCKGKEV